MHPVVNVSWQDAVAFCRWLASASGRPFRLPSEAEWEKAASWDEQARQKRIWPWGDTFDATKCNSRTGKKDGVTPVGAYSPTGDSAYGVADMAGNVGEWTRSLWGKDGQTLSFVYPYDPADRKREDLDASLNTLRVMRGGTFRSIGGFVRCAYRSWSFPNRGDRYHGFRVVVASP